MPKPATPSAASWSWSKTVVRQSSQVGWLVKDSGDKHRLQRKIQGKNTKVCAVSLPDDELDDAEESQT